MKYLFLSTALIVTAMAASAAVPTDATPSSLGPDAAEQTSALFFSTCAVSNGQEKEFTKKMQSLVAAKRR